MCKCHDEDSQPPRRQRIRLKSHAIRGESPDAQSAFAFAVEKLWRTLQRYQDAGNSFEVALAKAVAVYGREQALVASILLSLGAFLSEIDRLPEALLCFDEATKARTALHGSESLEVAEVVYGQGVALLFHERFEEANACLERALALRRARLGPADCAVGDTLNSLGFLQLRRGRIAGRQALDPLEEALEIRRAAGNADKVASTLQNIGSVWKKQKNLDKWVDAHADIVTVRQEEFGLDDVRVANAWIALGNVQTSAGRLSEALASYEEALRLRTLRHGYHDSAVAQVLLKMSALHARRGNHAGADQLLAEYMRIRGEAARRCPDEEMAQALTTTGDVHKEMGDKARAQICWADAESAYRRLGYPETDTKLLKLRARRDAFPAGPAWLSTQSFRRSKTT